MLDVRDVVEFLQPAFTQMFIDFLLRGLAAFDSVVLDERVEVNADSVVRGRGEMFMIGKGAGRMDVSPQA